MGAGATKVDENEGKVKDAKQSGRINASLGTNNQPRAVIIAPLTHDVTGDRQTDEQVTISKPQMSVGHLADEDYVSPDGKTFQNVHIRSPPVISCRTSVVSSINSGINEHSTPGVDRNAFTTGHSQNASLPEVSS